jgi:hypothetical protein
MYSDDIDLSYMVLKQGRQNYYFADTTVIHYKGESTVRDGAYMERFRQAMQFFYKKHFRSSAKFDFFMRVGTLFFAMAKKNKKVPVVKPQQYLLVSEDEGLFAVLQSRFDKKVTRISRFDAEALTLSGKNTEVIFDNSLLSFSTIISLMEKYRHKEVTFKIKPAGSNFIIGSNSSNDRGEVILLQEIDKRRE